MDGLAPVPPEGLRPAQLGVLLVGRVIPGHVGATVADLAARGYLRLEGSGSDWALTDVRPPDAPARGGLLGYEKELLAGLFNGRREVVLGELGEPFVRTLDRVRVKLARDAVRSGRLSRWRRGKRTKRGAELLAAVREFRRGLRAAAAAGDLAPAQVPYAMAFGLSHGPAARLPVAPAGPAARPADPEVPQSRSLSSPSLRNFTGTWQLTCSRLAEPYGGHLPGFAPPPGAGSQHSPAGHDQGHATWAGDHGGSSGGHVGGHAGGHH